MSKPIRVKRPTTKRVVDTSAKTPKISPQQVASALGAYPEGQVAIAPRKGRPS